ncbi:hypothetical protein Tco_1040707 [Tanacetum coccineum]
MTYSYPKRSFIPQVVLTGTSTINTAGANVNTVGASINIVIRPINTAASTPIGNLQQKEYKEIVVINSGCSRHMTRNKWYLDEYEDYDGGFVSFGDGKGRISRKGTRDNIVVGQAEKKTKPKQEYILILICTTNPLISQGLKDSKEDAGVKPTEVDESEASDKDGKDEQDSRSDTVEPSSTYDAPSSPVNAAKTSEDHLIE